MCARDIEFTYFYDFSIECWNCSDSVVYIFSFYSSTHINDPSWLSSGTSIKSDGVKLVYSRFF
jgi:hypothetical protein